VGVPLVAEPEETIPLRSRDASKGIASKAILLVFIAGDSQEEPGMTGDFLVVGELDDEVAIAVAEVLEAVFLEKGLDGGVIEALDESHPHTMASASVPSFTLPL
jgi:hypothetical protein